MTHETGLMAVLVMFTVCLAAGSLMLWYIGEGGFAALCGFAAVCGGAMIARARRQQKMMGGDE